MKSILDEAGYREVYSRVSNLKPETLRLWGRMNVAQMLAHCSTGLEMACGKITYKDSGNFIFRTLVKRIVFSQVKKGAFKKNLGTVPVFLISDERDFEKEKQRALESLRQFHAAGKQGTLLPHPAFGKFTMEEWGSLQYVHWDHHLKQFSA